MGRLHRRDFLAGAAALGTISPILGAARAATGDTLTIAYTKPTIE